MSLFRNAQRKFASRAAAPLDFGMLLATLNALQGTAPTVRLMAREAEEQAGIGTLVEILLGGPQWREAVRVQRGRFSPLCSGPDVNGR